MEPLAPRPEDLTADAIAVAAQQPQSAAVDGQQAAAHPLPDQIEADRYRRTVAATAGGQSGWGCLRAARVRLPGATG